MIKFLCCVPGPHGSEEAPVRIVDAPDGYFIKKDLKTVAEIMTNPANYPKWTHALLKYGGDVVDGTKTDGDSVTFRIAWGANDPEAKGLASLVTVTKFEDPGKLVLELDAYMFDESVPSDEVASVFAGGGDGLHLKDRLIFTENADGTLSHKRVLLFFDQHPVSLPFILQNWETVYCDDIPHEFDHIKVLVEGGEPPAPAPAAAPEADAPAAS